MASSSANIYYGPRDDSFLQVIVKVLEKGKLKKKYIDMLTDEEGMELYSQIFTHSSADPENNYEYYETLGDVTANKCITWYFSKRFPQINCPKGVKILARLKIVYASKEVFAPIGEKLGFWPFITASNEIRSTDMRPCLEDVLEAFIGATEYLIDKKIGRNGVGYAIVYDIIASIYNEMPISLEYEKLVDPKTILKEVFDYFKRSRTGLPPIGDLKYQNIRDAEHGFHTSKVLRLFDGRPFILGEGKERLQIDAEQAAARQALPKLKQMGYFKPVPEEYSMFSRYN